MLETGIKHDTDKITHHGYHRFYSRYLDPLVNTSNLGIIEIGMDKLKSLNMWLEYLPLAFIYGLDIGVESEGERFLISKTDQSKVDQLKQFHNKIIDKGHDIMFINDDGSHIPEH